MVQIPSKLLTLAEFLTLPETEPASEFINGEIIQKPMPKGKHSIIQGELVSVINAVLKPRKIARAFPELRCTFAEKSIVPDVSVFLWERIPRDQNGEVANVFNIAPEWIIEILSLEQSQTKVTKKILQCLKDGTQMGWLIDTEEQTIFVYLVNQQPEVFDQLEAKLPVPSFASNLQLTVGQIFGWLLE